MSNKVALITGGASGFGLATAIALMKRGGWNIHLLDINTERGHLAAKEVGATFHQADVAMYSSQAKAFDAVFKIEGRFDFVWANAGVLETWDFYQRHEETPPPEPNQSTIDVDVKGVVYTTYLAQHYFRLSQPSYGTGKQTLIMTASEVGLYSAPFRPVYSAAKHAVVGVARAVAKPFHEQDKIRVNCICPGLSRTNIMGEEGYSHFSEDVLTPVDKQVETVLMLLDGGDLKDSSGKIINKNNDWMLVAETSGQNFYFRDIPPFCDDVAAKVMGMTGL